MRKKAPKLRHIYLLSLLAVFLLPLAACVLTYRLSYQALEQEVIRSSNSDLENLRFQIDGQLQAALSIVEAAAQDSAVDSLIQLDGNRQALSGYRKYAGWNNMRAYHTQFMEDLFLYLHDSDTAVSAYRSLQPLPDYCRMYFGADPADIPGLRQRIWDTGVIAVIPWTVSGGQNTLALTRSLPLSAAKNHTCKAVCIMDRGSLLTMMQTLMGGEPGSGSLGLFTSSGACVVAGSDALRALALPSAEPGIREQTLDGEPCLVNVTPSRFDNLLYVSVIPTAYISRQLEGYKLTSFLIILLSFALGLGLTLYLSRKNYAPVRQLVSSVQAMTAPGEEPVIPRHSNEFTYVMDKFRQTVERMEESREAAQRAYLLELTGGVQPADAETFSRLSLPFEGMRFVVALLQAFPAPAGPDAPSFPDAARRLCGLPGTAIRADLYACVRSTQAEDAVPDTAASLLDAVHTLARTTGGRVILALSEVCCGEDGIETGFRQASRALEYHRVDDDAEVLYYREAPPFKPAPAYANTARSSILTFLETASASPAEAAAALAALYTGGQTLPPEEIAGFAKATWAVLETLCGEYGLTSEPLHERDTLQAVLDNCADRLDALRYRYAQSRENSSASAQIKRYIEEHYMDMTLGVNTIAYRFALSPSHCSQIFRRETNTGINDYLIQTRIRAACQLLTETDLSIEQIAVDTGFSGSSVFIRVFKKECGVTPGLYRKARLTAPQST